MKGGEIFLWLLAILLVFILLDSSATAASGYSEKDQALIIRALKVYRDLHRGDFRIRTVATSISNNRHILKQRLEVAGQTFTWTQSFPVQKPPLVRNNGLYLWAGAGFGLTYTRRLFSGFSLIGTAGLNDGSARFSAGVGWRFGR